MNKEVQRLIISVLLILAVYGFELLTCIDIKGFFIGFGAVWLSEKIIV